MKIFFPEKNPDSIVSSLETAMGDRALSKIVSFSQKNEQLIVTLSKLGTSTLSFDRSESADGTTYTLAKEKIALSHRPLKSDVTGKIIKVVERAGGTVEK
ncbi:MAG: hypothetical protein HRU19_06185 [Pseudobacteriovorax sp.]|nr:hypothetical protein [Pseudobacteriovorax sp.]